MTSFPKAIAAAAIVFAISNAILSPATAGPKSTDRPTSRISNEAAQLEDNATLRQVYSTSPRRPAERNVRQIQRPPSRLK